MKAPPGPLPTWRKWLYRFLGGFLILGSALIVPRTVTAVLFLKQSWSGKGTLSDEALASMFGYVTGYVVGVVALLLTGIWLLRRSWRKAGSRPETTTPPMVETERTFTAASRPRRGRMAARFSYCNVLHAGAETRQLWQFNASGKFNLLREETKLPSEALSKKLVAKDWEALFQPRLNVAWLSPEKVYLRVIQLPKSDPGELRSMLELQLEKLSPLPTAQIVWSYELLEHPSGDMQTAIVVVVGRHVVEEFLGQLEGHGYLADRLEVPLLDQLRATNVSEDGAWIYPGLGVEKSSCMVAWWSGGVLQHLALIHIPPGNNRGAALHEQLTQMSWAGELEGWLAGPPKFHLVADPDTLAEWTLPFDPSDTTVPLQATELAALTARRAVGANGAINLIPPEYSQRYRQQFMDRLWMRGLGAVILAYIFIAGIYVLLVQIADWRYEGLQQQVRTAGINYTNTIQIKERVRVLQDQIDLQWAALDCYRTVAENMPTELTLDAFSFDGGRRLTLNGTGESNEDREKVFDFLDKLRTASARDQLLFKTVDAQRILTPAGGGGLTWSLVAELRRTDTP